MDTDKLMDIVINSDVVASETLRSLIKDGYEISKEQIEYILEWSGDDEYVSVEDILDI